MKRYLGCILIFLGVTWVALFLGAQEVVQRQVQWEEHGVELSGFEIWMAVTSSWLMGQLHENQAFPGLVYVTILFIFIAGAIVWLLVRLPKQQIES